MKKDEPYYEWPWEKAKFLMDCVNNRNEYTVYHNGKYGGKSHCHRFKPYKVRAGGLEGPETGEVSGTFSCVEWSQSDFPEPITKYKPEEFHVYRIMPYPWMNQVSITDV